MDRTFLGQGAKAARILIVSEEAEALWKRRRDRLAIPGSVSLISRPFRGRPSNREWEEFIGFVAKKAEEHELSLVVFDSLPNLWPVRDENDAAEVQRALVPLNVITATNAAVLLLAHPRKGDGGQGQGTRGSGALPAFADIILELRRSGNGHVTETRRTITGFSRFEETPSELIIEYWPESGYEVVGSTSDVHTDDLLETLESFLPPCEPGFTFNEIRMKWPTGDVPKPGLSTLKKILKGGSERLLRSGAGTKGDPYRFCKREDDSIPASSTPKGEPESNPAEAEPHAA